MGAFNIVARDGSFKSDQSEIRRAIQILFGQGEWHELRALPSGRGKIVIGGGWDAAVESAVSLSDESVYYCLNPISKDAERAKKATVVSRRWFPLDIDTVRPRDVSATEAEKAKSAEVAYAIFSHLNDLGWPEPVMVDSGNGWHLLYRIDLPHSDLSTQIIKSATYRLAEQFDTAFGKVDKATHDAPRVFKLPGTFARKGPDTSDRPWRIAKIVYDPETIGVVSGEQLQNITAKESDQQPSPWTAKAVNGQGLIPYIASALSQECGRVALAIEGERNTALNRAAFSMGQFCDWPEFDPQSVRQSLTRAASQVGLQESEINQTLDSGWEAGKKEPRKRPEDIHMPDAIPIGTKLTVGADEVQPEKVVWLWEDRIALGFISLFAGRTGVGKSFVLCDVAARLSTGREFPDGSSARPIQGTLFISEDPYQYVLVPRLMELDADRSKIGFMKWEAMASYSLSNIDLLQRAWEERGKPELIVIDPPANFLGGKDEHKNSEVRSVLMKIVSWLDGKPVAMALITHYNKGGAQKVLDALDRIMGSVAWASSARVACGFVADPNDQSQCIFGGIKNNLGKKAVPLSYKIEATPSLAKVTWLGKSDTSLDDAMSQTGAKKVNAAKFFVERFREKLEWESQELIDVAKKSGISRNTCFDTKDALDIQGRQLRDAGGHCRVRLVC